MLLVLASGGICASSVVMNPKIIFELGICQMFRGVLRSVLSVHPVNSGRLGMVEFGYPSTSWHLSVGSKGLAAKGLFRSGRLCKPRGASTRLV